MDIMNESLAIHGVHHVADLKVVSLVLLWRARVTAAEGIAIPVET
jgi:hypothetical protein